MPRLLNDTNLFMRPLSGREKPPINGKPDIGDHVDDDALAVNSRTREEIAEFPHPEIAIDSLKATLEKYVNKFDPKDKFVCAGKNVRFDIDFLRECFRKTNNKYFGSYFFSVSLELETFAAEMVLSKGLRLKNYSLGTLCDHFNVEIDAHEAMSDIIATRSLYRHLRNELCYKVFSLRQDN